jgi:hypothetical protein
MLKTYSQAYFKSNILKRLHSAEGLAVPKSNYIISKRGNQLTLHFERINSDVVLRLYIENTNYCCGVAQAGAFYEHGEALNVPNAVLDYMFKLLISLTRFQYRKGVIQGWFFRWNRPDSTWMHPTIMKMFERNGMTLTGEDTYNPNSGNIIRGFQGSIARRGGQ